MTHGLKTKDIFTLSFGGDEFDSDKFKYIKQSMSVKYVGLRQFVASGFTYQLYEFETDGRNLLFIDGKSTGKTIFLVTSPPVDDHSVSSWGAKILLLNPEDNKVLPVGRASLFR